MTTYLVQNIETFATITTFASEAAFDAWLSESSIYGIVSLEVDADGEYDYIALVAPLAGPDFVMDMTTGEMEPAETVDPAAELEAKLDIAMEIDNHDEEIFAAITVQDNVREEEPETAIIAAPSKPRNKRKSRKSKTNTQTQGKTMKNHEVLAAFISANPGVTRDVVFNDASLLLALRSSAQIAAIGKGDKQEVKRWNSCINRFIRKIRRDGTDIQVNGQGKSATYTIGTPSGQLELPFDEAAEARNAAIANPEAAPVVAEVETAPEPKFDARRAEEEANQSLSFESLLATLDDEAATVKSDDQVAFEAAQEMLK